MVLTRNKIKTPKIPCNMEYNIKEDRLDLDPEGNRKNSHKLTTVNIVFDGLQ